MEEEDAHWDYGEDGDALVACLEIGDIFVVNVATNNDEDQEFWIIKCSKPLHIELIKTLLMRGVFHVRLVMM